ncbi:SIMPL domain-containing protein [Stigmatella sp. ncwal1]|uniref:SIMPL domain-containing protein n=1 Tax=Stigmatella ashevillensis TaxID=2995309 RepID=A0ABT5DFK4_9BACT|nr:SIMPL domain-containing protein [Stigmatella ashevillena]MDC0712388.1 SIMPL domain-containing protein [Stigmatella ashevillena]
MKTSRIVSMLALLTSLTAGAQAQPVASSRPAVDPSVRTLRVEGSGETKARPDEAWIDLAVETQGATAKVAGEENAKKMERLLAALTAAGVARKEMETRNYSVYPEYAQPDPRAEAKLRGYRANNTLSVHVRELTRLGELIDRALASGANRVDGVRFGLSKADAVRAESLRQAVERARKSAEVLASALGVRLGEVLDASTVAEPPQLYPARALMAMSDKSADASTQILPEDQTVQARVTLVYAIESAR